MFILNSHFLEMKVYNSNDVNLRYFLCHFLSPTLFPISSLVKNCNYHSWTFERFEHNSNFINIPFSFILNHLSYSNNSIAFLKNWCQNLIQISFLKWNMSPALYSQQNMHLTAQTHTLGTQEKKTNKHKHNLEEDDSCINKCFYSQARRVCNRLQMTTSLRFLKVVQQFQLPLTFQWN